MSGDRQQQQHADGWGHEEAPQRSAPRDCPPGSSRRGPGAHHSRYNNSNSPSTEGPPGANRHSSSSSLEGGRHARAPAAAAQGSGAGTAAFQQRSGGTYSSSPGNQPSSFPGAGRFQRGSGGSSGGSRYGQWPPPGSSPAEGGAASRAGSGSSGSSRSGGRQGSQQGLRSSGSHGRHSGRGFTWPAYMDRVQLQQAMKRGHVFRAKFRVNAANRTEGFCTLEGLPSDLLVRGDVNQARAVEGDEVAVLPFKLQDWFKVYKEQDKLAELGLLPGEDADPLALSEKLTQLAIDANDDEALAVAQSPWQAASSSRGALKHLEKLLLARTDLRVTGKVVSILEPSKKREAIVGVLLPVATALAASPPPGSNPGPVAAAAAAALAAGAYQDCLMLFPLDPRLPKCIIGPQAVAQLPQELRQEAASEEVSRRTFVTCAITEWPADSPFPYAEVRQSLGPSDDIEAGTKALLAQEKVVEEDFGLEVYACLPKVPWSISPADMANRADFTSWRIFSIDPITARDLDDALSIQPLGGGRWRVGVHIADVASFVRPDTPLDVEAAKRGTSVYLVQRVIPMLPRLLCEELCSLHPGYPRFAFSIVWEVDESGTIHREWAGRSVISSRAKLAYPMVQQMIEGCFDPAPWGVQLHEGATWQEIQQDCLALNGIASRLREARFKAGALRMNNTRLSFALDTGGNPVSASPYVQTDANFLVEEYMLLANMRVAALIARAFPKHALLRRHPPPSARKMKELHAVGEKLGVKVDDSTAGTLALSLQALKDACKDEASSQALMLLATKPMQLAQYFCTYIASDPLDWRHYALAVGHYTHFTSPIRRYPDVIVHRLLAAALELQQQQQQPDNADLLTAPMVEGQALPAPVDYSQTQYDPAFAAAAAAQDAAATATPADGGSDDGTGSDGGYGSDGGSSEDLAAAEDALEAPEATAMLRKHQLPAAKQIEQIAKHSNDTKLSARQVSDGSLKLYLCIMLRNNPVVTMAVATSVGGDRFFQAYLPELGCETRITLSMMGVPLTGSFDSNTETLTITYKQPGEEEGGDEGQGGQQQQQQPSASSAAGRRRAFQQQQQQQDGWSSGSSGGGGGQGLGQPQQQPDQQQQLKPSNAELGLNNERFNMQLWLEHMHGKILNRQHIRKAALPLQIRQLTHFPVVASSYSNRVTLCVEDIACKLWIPCSPEDEGGSGVEDGEGAAPSAPVAAGDVVPSAMALETLYED